MWAGFDRSQPHYAPVLALPKRRLVLLFLLLLAPRFAPGPRPLLVPLERLGDRLPVDKPEGVAVVIIKAAAAPQPGVGLVD
jgi:hypothetical protein